MNVESLGFRSQVHVGDKIIRVMCLWCYTSLHRIWSRVWLDAGTLIYLSNYGDKTIHGTDY